MNIRILLADDHRIFRDALKTLINHEADMEVVGEADDGQRAIELARNLHPDVILMDVKMNDMDGFETTYNILSEMPHTKILALSMFTDNGFIKGMIQAGCVGYLAKDCESKELYEAIRKAAGTPSPKPSQPAKSFFSDRNV